MTAHVLVSGTLFRSPEARTGKASGKSFVVASIKTRDGGTTQFWKVLAFSDTAQSELLRLDDGDALSVQGSLRAEAYAKDNGELRVNLTVLADAVLPLRRLKQKRQEPEPRQDAHYIWSAIIRAIAGLRALGAFDRRLEAEGEKP